LHALGFEHREAPVIRVAIERVVWPLRAHHTDRTVIVDAEEKMTNFMRHHTAEQRAAINVHALCSRADAIGEHRREPAAVGLPDDVGDAEDVGVKGRVERRRIELRMASAVHRTNLSLRRVGRTAGRSE